MTDNPASGQNGPDFGFLTNSPVESSILQDEPTMQQSASNTTIAGNSPAKKKRRLGRGLAEWLLVIVIAALIAFLTRTFALQTFFIPSGSMSPTLQVGDRILVNKVYGTIHTGDIVVFRRAAADPQVQYQDLVKRVIGLPGQRVTWQGNNILINGQQLPQPWLPTLTGVCAEVPRTSGSLVVPKNEYFVMGDCRGDSYDSRYWGPVPSSHIIGKVIAIVWRHGSPDFHWF